MNQESFLPTLQQLTSTGIDADASKREKKKRLRWVILTVQKRLIWVKIDDFFSRVTLKFDGWPWKTTGHLFYATSSFVQPFVAIDEFKLELQSGNA